MANRPATKKDVSQNAKRKKRSAYYGKTTRNAIRDLIDSQKVTSPEVFSNVVSMIDKLAKRGTIHKNKAGSLKSKLAIKTNVVNAVAYLGGDENLPLKSPLETENDYIQLIRSGVAKKSIDNLIEATDISTVEMSELMETTPRKLAAIKPDTLMEKSQSEKAVSIARLYGLGQEVFGSKDEFNKWMNGRVPSLGKKRPKEYLDTISGINLLMDELGRIQHGVYS